MVSLNNQFSLIKIFVFAGPDCYIKDAAVQNTARNQQYSAQPHRPMSPSTESSGGSPSSAEPDTESHLKYCGNET